MPVDWKSSRDVAAAAKILKKLDQVLRVNPDGSVSLGWEGELEYGSSIVASGVRFSDQLRDHQRLALARRAILDAKKSGDLSIDAVLANLRNGQRQYLRQPEKRYVLLSGLSMQYCQELRTIRLYGATITFSKFKPRSFKLPDSARKMVSSRGWNTTRNTAVRAAVRARDPESAGDEAIDRIDFVRALWNFFYNYRSRRISLGGPGRRPFNDLLSGPIHTLHNPDGSRASESFWWEPSYPEYVPVKSIRNDVDKLKEFERFVRTQLRKSAIEGQLVSLLIRYVRALDERDLTSGFLKLWALLEDITAIPPGNYDLLIRRALFLMDDGDYHSLVLEHLRAWRNRIVHDSHQLNDVDPLLNDLKRYVEILLLFLIRHSKEFATLSDYGDFLSLPRSRGTLRRRVQMHKLALTLPS